MEVCDYGCGKIAQHIFKNGKKCCSKSLSQCVSEKERRKIVQHTVDPITGLTPLQQREKTLREKIDPITGLTSLQKRTEKIKITCSTIDPETGLSIHRNIQKKMIEDIDPETGLNKKQRAAFKSIEKMKNTIDPDTGLTVWENRIRKVKETWYKKQPDELEDIKKRREKTTTAIDPATGLSIRQKSGIKTSQHRKLIDSVTGLTNAQLIAKKNMENKRWLSNSTKGKASKESLRLFNDIVEKIQDLNLTCYYGHSNGKEWWLKTKDGKVKFYDFTIPELKLIIEYQGERYHPNPEKLSKEEWKEWKIPYNNTTADEVYANDQEKYQLAMENGWQIIYVWSNNVNDNTVDDLLSTIKNIFNSKFKMT